MQNKGGRNRCFLKQGKKDAVHLLVGVRWGQSWDSGFEQGNEEKAKKHCHGQICFFKRARTFSATTIW